MLSLNKIEYTISVIEIIEYCMYVLYCIEHFMNKN